MEWLQGFQYLFGQNGRIVVYLDVVERSQNNSQVSDDLVIWVFSSRMIQCCWLSWLFSFKTFYDRSSRLSEINIECEYGKEKLFSNKQTNNLYFSKTPYNDNIGICISGIYWDDQIDRGDTELDQASGCLFHWGYVCRVNWNCIWVRDWIFSKMRKLCNVRCVSLGVLEELYEEVVMSTVINGKEASEDYLQNDQMREN